MPLSLYISPGDNCHRHRAFSGRVTTSNVVRNKKIIRLSKLNDGQDTSIAVNINYTRLFSTANAYTCTLYRNCTKCTAENEREINYKYCTYGKLGRLCVLLFVTSSSYSFSFDYIEINSVRATWLSGLLFGEIYGVYFHFFFFHFQSRTESFGKSLYLNRSGLT